MNPIRNIQKKPCCFDVKIPLGSCFGCNTGICKNCNEICENTDCTKMFCNKCISYVHDPEYSFIRTFCGNFCKKQFYVFLKKVS